MKEKDGENMNFNVEYVRRIFESEGYKNFNDEPLSKEEEEEYLDRFFESGGWIVPEHKYEPIVYKKGNVIDLKGYLVNKVVSEFGHLLVIDVEQLSKCSIRELKIVLRDD